MIGYDPRYNSTAGTQSLAVNCYPYRPVEEKKEEHHTYPKKRAEYRDKLFLSRHHKKRLILGAA